ncbi:MAG TPA: ABC transporter ATP-binding protein [Ktedonobacteraceae bacterium]|nr:ABC transporter ATP-binding protein [Ktedonobacteraceae bacterium]
MSVTAQHARQSEAPREGEAVLEAEHLRKVFPVNQFNPFAARLGVHAVEDASFTLYAGRVTALVGESGSGKTTIARMLAGVYPPTSGTIRLHGKPVNLKGGRERHEFRRQVQLVFQDPFGSLNPVHTIRYILSRPLRVFGHARSGAEVSDRVMALLQRVSLVPVDQFIQKYPHQLSGGQRQRVSIARALAAQPEVLLADEPVSMLDVSIRLQILNLLLRLKEEEHLALLYITHDIASARYFADETLVMYAGQMVEGGPGEEITQNPKHPYTQLLLSAAPDPDRLEEGGGLRKLPERRGEIPSLIHPPSGCRFHPRCPYAMEVCKQRFPKTTDLGNGHWTNCYLYGDGGTNLSGTPVVDAAAIRATNMTATAAKEGDNSGNGTGEGKV